MLRGLAVGLVLLSCMGTARADGPHIALHAVQGPYEVTLFSAPDPLVTGPIQLTALVQDAQTGAVLSPVTVTGGLLLTRSGQSSAVSIQLNFSRDASSNSQLPGQSLTIAEAGDYALQLDVHAAGQPELNLRGDLPVSSNRGRRNTVLWAVFAVVAMVFLFLANQKARQAMARHQARSR